MSVGVKIRIASVWQGAGEVASVSCVPAVGDTSGEKVAFKIWEQITKSEPSWFWGTSNAARTVLGPSGKQLLALSLPPHGHPQCLWQHRLCWCLPGCLWGLPAPGLCSVGLILHECPGQCDTGQVVCEDGLEASEIPLSSLLVARNNWDGRNYKH